MCLGIKDKCVICGEKIQIKYNPMEDWQIEGSLCGKCYSKKINEFYPGEHIRVNRDSDR